MKLRTYPLPSSYKVCNWVGYFRNNDWGWRRGPLKDFDSGVSHFIPYLEKYSQSEARITLAYYREIHCLTREFHVKIHDEK